MIFAVSLALSKNVPGLPVLSEEVTAHCGGGKSVSVKVAFTVRSVAQLSGSREVVEQATTFALTLKGKLDGVFQETSPVRSPVSLRLAPVENVHMTLAIPLPLTA